jgi:formylmethanofuran dehydrogenase subunit E
MTFEQWLLTPEGQRVCRKCGEDRLTEKIGAQWVCKVCAHHWTSR